ncbi:hypothetical protein K7432_004386 [Basidiobolus ranarum]|uniref:Uncharacterized protein n=1 Tax=Basidiobolus ranarum TaxID=34480 RepID=A0ABR2WYD2_9FUNG
MNLDTQPKLNAFVELLLVTFTFPLVIQDVYHSIRMVLKDQAVIYKINLIQTSLLLCTGLMNLGIRVFGHQFSCLIYFYSYNIMAFSSVTLLLTLVFLKSLCINRHIRLIKGLFGFSQIIHLVVEIFMLMNTRDIFANFPGNCSWITEDFYVIILLSNSTCVVIFLASMVIISMYKQAKVNSFPIFKVFIRDGIIILILITLVTVIVLILQILKVIQSGILLHGWWIIMSLLTTQQCHTSYRLRRKDLYTHESDSNHTTIVRINHHPAYSSNHPNLQASSAVKQDITAISV